MPFLLFSCILTRSVAISQSSFLKLFCYVRSDDYKHAFEVKIGMEESVAALKKAIKEEKSHMFRSVDADSLVLWNVNISCDEHLKEAVDKRGLVDGQSLSPFTGLSKVFPHQPEDGHLHIVVKAPPPGEYELLSVTTILMSFRLFVLPCRYYVLKYNPPRCNHPISFTLPYQDQLVESVRLPLIMMNSVNYVVRISKSCQGRLHPVWANRRNFESGNNRLT
jgi:hypothetical protein